MVKILSGGAANGLVSRLRDSFLAQTGSEIEGDFGAVGGMRDRVMQGEAVDLIILTRAIAEALAEAGKVHADSLKDVGRVITGMAARSGDPAPDVSTAEAVKAALLAADEIYISDPVKSTAGQHFMKMLAAMGITDTIEPRLQCFPSGHIGMNALARCDATRPLGCTQATEIVPTDGVDYLGDLPSPHDLVTVYTTAIATDAADPEAARALQALLTAESEAETRSAAGFA